MQTLTDSLAKAIPGNCIRKGCVAKKIAYEFQKNQWRIDFEKSESRLFDAVCISSSARSAGFLLKDEFRQISERLSQISYESVATVNFAYKKEQVGHLLNGFGFVVPKIENKSLIACSFSSQKFGERAPEGHVLLRVFAGGAFGNHIFEKADNELLLSVESDLRQYLRIQGSPIFTQLQRHPRAMVQYRLGHLDLVAGIRSAVHEFNGLHLTGSSYGGAGIPDCVREAENEARKILTSLHDKERR